MKYLVIYDTADGEENHVTLSAVEDSLEAAQEAARSALFCHGATVTIAQVLKVITFDNEEAWFKTIS